MIKKNIENWSIVILGFWNSRIFTPPWMSDVKLTDTKNIVVEIAVNNPDSPMRFSFEDIYLRVTDRRLILNPSKEDDHQLEKIENIAVEILTELPHTPLNAVGINFQYINQVPKSEDLSIFNVGDTNLLSDLPAKIMRTSINRRLQIDDRLINFTISFEENLKVVYDFNFHKDLTKSQEAIEYIKGNVLKFKKEAENIVTNVYKQDLEEGDEND